MSGLMSWWPYIATVVAIGLAIYTYQRLKLNHLSKELNVQNNVIQHQEQIILSLQEELTNAHIKNKHHEVSMSIHADLLDERLQHQGYFRD